MENDHFEYLEAVNLELSRGVFHFKKIPDSNFLEALCESTMECELYFPLNKSLGVVSEVSHENWINSVKQIRIESDLLVEGADIIKKFSNVRHLVLILNTGRKIPYLLEGHISEWQETLMDFKDLQSLKIVLDTRTRSKKNREEFASKEEFEKFLGDLKYLLNPFSNGKIPETAIEQRRK